MRRFLAPLIQALAVLLAGCSSISYNHDFDQAVDFGAYGTYQWAPKPESPVDGSSDMLLSNDLVYRRIQAAVDRTLQSKGLKLADGPDLIVAIHTGVQDKVDVQGWGYGYGRRDFQVYNYKEGTLLVDLVDADANELVWRSTATGILKSNTPSQETAKDVGPIVERMFRQYPGPAAPK